MAKLIVGLGNPGLEYEFTRHNIGRLALDQLSFYDGLAWKNKFKGSFASYNFDGKKVHFLTPETFMNRSGESVQEAGSFYKIATEDILVVHDELDIPFGTMVFKLGGGAAGHNGIKSTAQMLGSPDFPRLRLGIGRPTEGKNTTAHVLGNFNGEEEKHLEAFLSEAAKAIETFIKEDFQRAASLYSKKDTLPCR